MGRRWLVATPCAALCCVFGCWWHSHPSAPSSMAPRASACDSLQLLEGAADPWAPDGPDAGCPERYVGCLTVAQSIALRRRLEACRLIVQDLHALCPARDAGATAQ